MPEKIPLVRLRNDNAEIMRPRVPLLTTNPDDFRGLVSMVDVVPIRHGLISHTRRMQPRRGTRSGMLSRVTRWEDLLRRATRAVTLLTQERRPPARPRSPEGRARTAPARDRARRIVYAPDLDGAADPGEIVWTWVPYEEGDGRGKDRPVLVVGRHHGELLGLMLSSRADHADDRDWVGIGSGRWDARGRPSYVRLDRVIEVGEHAIRREGAVLDEARFDRVAEALRSRFGWT